MKLLIVIISASFFTNQLYAKDLSKTCDVSQAELSTTHKLITCSKDTTLIACTTLAGFIAGRSIEKRQLTRIHANYQKNKSQVIKDTVDKLVKKAQSFGNALDQGFIDGMSDPSHKTYSGNNSVEDKKMRDLRKALKRSKPRFDYLSKKMSNLTKAESKELINLRKERAHQNMKLKEITRTRLSITSKIKPNKAKNKLKKFLGNQEALKKELTRVMSEVFREVEVNHGKMNMVDRSPKFFNDAANRFKLSRNLQHVFDKKELVREAMYAYEEESYDKKTRSIVAKRNRWSKKHGAKEKLKAPKRPLFNLLGGGPIGLLSGAAIGMDLAVSDSGCKSDRQKAEFAKWVGGNECSRGKHNLQINSQRMEFLALPEKARQEILDSNHSICKYYKSFVDLHKPKPKIKEVSCNGLTASVTLLDQYSSISSFGKKTSNLKLKELKYRWFRKSEFPYSVEAHWDTGLDKWISTQSIDQETGKITENIVNPAGPGGVVPPAEQVFSGLSYYSGEIVSCCSPSNPDTAQCVAKLNKKVNRYNQSMKTLAK